MAAAPIIELQHIKKAYGEKTVLNDLSMTVYPNEFVSIVGASGSGKSTIFNLVSHLQEPSGGELSVPERIGYMQQKDLLLPWKTILDNVVLPLDLQRKNKKVSREEARRLLDKIGLAGYEDKYPSELSGGMKQRVNFLRTFLASDKVLLLDEPFGALDSLTKSLMQKWLLDIKEEFQLTILFITHDIEEALFLSDRIYVMSSELKNFKEEIVLDFHNDEKLARLRSEKLLHLKEEILAQL